MDTPERGMVDSLPKPEEDNLDLYEDEDFQVLYESPDLSIVFIEGEYKGECHALRTTFTEMAEVAAGFGLKPTEWQLKGDGFIDLTFKKRAGD